MHSSKAEGGNKGDRSGYENLPSKGSADLEILPGDRQ